MKMRVSGVQNRIGPIDVICMDTFFKKKKKSFNVPQKTESQTGLDEHEGE